MKEHKAPEWEKYQELFRNHCILETDGQLFNWVVDPKSVDDFVRSLVEKVQEEERAESLRDFLLKGGLKAAEDAGRKIAEARQEREAKREHKKECLEFWKHNNCEHYPIKPEGGGWRERFENRFLKDADEPLGPSLKIQHGTLSFIGELKAFIEAELKAAEERARRETIAEVIALVNEHDPQGAKSRITASKHYWGNTLKDELARLQGSGGGTNV
jgi:hypothetical protein